MAYRYDPVLNIPRKAGLSLRVTNNGDGTATLTWSGYNLEAIDVDGTWHIQLSSDNVTWSDSVTGISSETTTYELPVIGSFYFRVEANDNADDALTLSNSVYKEITGSVTTNYYVKSGGSDAADGLSDANAWATLAKVAATSFSPGDAINLKRGDTWAEFLAFPSSGSAGLPIVLRSYGAGALPIIDGGNSRDKCIEISSKNYITLTNLDCWRAVGSCYNFIGTSSNIITNNCVGRNSGNQAFQHLTSASVTHNNVTAHGCTDDGLSQHNSTVVVVNTGNFYDNAQGIQIIDAATFTGYDITCSNNSTEDVYALGTAGVIAGSPVAMTITNFTGDGLAKCSYAVLNITNPTISGASAGVVSNAGGFINITGGSASAMLASGGGYIKATGTSFGGNGVALSGSAYFVNTADASEVNLNRCHFNGCTNDQINIGGTSEVNIDHCIFDNLTSAKYAIVTGSTGVARVFNSVFYDANTNGNGISVSGTATVKNCIFTSLASAIDWFTGATLTLDANDLYANTTNFGGDVYGSGNTGGITTDPLLVDPANGDFHISSGSPCEAIGVYVGSEEDYYENAVGSTPDIGAHQVTTATSLATTFGANVISGPFIAVQKNADNWAGDSGKETALHAFFASIEADGYTAKIKELFLPLFANATLNRQAVIQRRRVAYVANGGSISHNSDGISYSGNSFIDSRMRPADELGQSPSANGTAMFFKTWPTQSLNVATGLVSGSGQCVIYPNFTTNSSIYRMGASGSALSGINTSALDAGILTAIRGPANTIKVYHYKWSDGTFSTIGSSTSISGTLFPSGTSHKIYNGRSNGGIPDLFLGTPVYGYAEFTDPSAANVQSFCEDLHTLLTAWGITP